MLGRINWLARAAGFAWIGVVAFAIFPPHGRYATTAQAAGYGLAFLSLLAWALLDAVPDVVGRRESARTAVYLTLAAAAGFGSAAGGGGLALITFAFVAAMVAGADLVLSAALSVTAAAVVAIEVSGLLSGGGYLIFLGQPVLVVSGLVIGCNRRADRVRAEQAAALLAQRERLAAEQRRADLLDERARLAREIHDVLAHSLGALGIQIQAARAVLTDSADVAKAAELLTGAQQLATDGLAEARRAVQALRRDPRPLEEELAELSDSCAQRYRVAVDFDTAGRPAPLPPDASLALLRVTQEALVNAAKHGSGQGVAVRLHYADRSIRLTVRNRLPAGVTAAPALRTIDGGYGLTGMRERLRLLDGTLQVGQRDGEWIVTAELPVRDAVQDMVGR